MEPPPEMTVDRKKLYARFNDEAHKMIDQWKAVLGPEVFSKLTEVADLKEDRFDFPTELWAKIVFDFAIAFRDQHNGAERLLASLQPLYHGKALSHMNKVEAMSTQQADEYVEDQCLIFEETKPYLLRRWGGG
jgi:hypothetical protein